MMGGAVILSAKAAFRLGCGYVGIRSNKQHYGEMLDVIPEVIFLDEDIIPDKTTAIAIGPGLSLNNDAKRLLMLAFSSNQPLVIDVDAINCMVENGLNPPKGSILTPHLGELKRILGNWDSPEDCLAKQRDYAQIHGVYLLQKGAYSKVCDPQGNIYVNSTGNASMAKAGMGDTLTGIIGSLLAQGYSGLEAINYGVYLHGLAGDIANQKLGNSLLPTDLIEALPEAIQTTAQNHEA